MFFLAGAAAGVLDTLGSLAASSALHGAAGAAVSGQAFNLGSSTNGPAAPSGADGGVGASRSSPGTMNALLSMQGRFGAGQAAPEGSTVRGYGHHHRYGIDPLRQSLAGPLGASDADSPAATTVTNADSGKLGRLIQQQARLSAAAAGQSLSTTA
jgi:hypothetical protein